MRIFPGQDAEGVYVGWISSYYTGHLTHPPASPVSAPQQAASPSGSGSQSSSAKTLARFASLCTIADSGHFDKFALSLANAAC